MARVIGIDLGTTYTCAAVVDRGEPRVLRSSLGYATVPSIVTFDDMGLPVVGQPAERGMILRPEDTIYGSKRLLGRHYLAGVRAELQPHFQYQLVPDDEGLVAARVCGRTVPLVEVSALILREMRRAAEESLGHAVDRAVVTVPAYFNQVQRALVREAGARAQLDVIRILNEPTAAALCFGWRRSEKKRLLVYDLGGGTFDVSIVELDASLFRVLATDGDTFLGGLDFDERIVELLVGRLEKRVRGAVALDPVGHQRLRAVAQEVKHQLSVQERTLVTVPHLRLADGREVELGGWVTRVELEEATRELVGRTLVVVMRALAGAGLTPRDIDEVLLVGGQTRMPLVQAELRELFDKNPSKRVHPDEVVALGAAIAAESASRFEPALLSDVMPIPIGIAVAGGAFHPVIERNTRVPHEATIELEAAPRVTRLKVAVYQGAKPSAADNEYLGALVVEPLPSTGGPHPVELRFCLDEECLLKVMATVVGTGETHEVALATQQTADEALEAVGAERVRTVQRSAAATAAGGAGAGAAAAGATGRRARGLRGLWRRVLAWVYAEP